MNSAATGTGVAVAARGALKRYGPVAALDGIDLEVDPGRFVVLLGPSGSGKSTLARCVAGVERLDGGSLALGGHLVADGRRHLPPERRDLAMVFQDYALWPHLTVAGNVAYALRRRHLAAAETGARVASALDRVGLGRLAERYPHQLSGGEQQRVALARAMVGRPGLVIFDEPLSNLDADLRERLRVEIATLCRESGATALYITHDQAEAFALADDMVVMDRGGIVQFGSPEQIYRRPATPFVARFTGLAAELPGRAVDRVGADQVLVEVAATPVLATAAGRVALGQAVGLHVRPTATTLAAGPGPGRLPGVVVDVAYRGRGYDHVIDCEAGPLTAVFDPRRHERGTPVAVRLDPEGCMAFPSAPAPGASRHEKELTAVTLSDRV